MTKKEMEFLGGRMKQLREKNGVKSLEAMATYIKNSENIVEAEQDTLSGLQKSTLSRAESGSAGEKTIIKWAKIYCQAFGYSEKHTEQFLRGDKIAVPDTSALLKNPQLVDELGEEYNIVVIPDIVKLISAHPLMSVFPPRYFCLCDIQHSHYRLLSTEKYLCPCCSPYL